MTKYKSCRKIREKIEGMVIERQDWISERSTRKIKEIIKEKN